MRLCSPPLVDVLLPEDRAAKLAPEELRRRQLAVMTAWTLASARTQAVVLAFEDLHWADPTSLDLRRALAERGRSTSIRAVRCAQIADTPRGCGVPDCAALTACQILVLGSSQGVLHNRVYVRRRR